MTTKRKKPKPKTCEWKVSREPFVFHITSCGNSLEISFEAYGFKFCPFCGKKIKVVTAPNEIGGGNG